MDLDSDDLESWRIYFKTSQTSIFNVINKAIMVAAKDYSAHLRLRRDQIVLLLYHHSRPCNQLSTTLEHEEVSQPEADQTCRKCSMKLDDNNFGVHGHDAGNKRVNDKDLIDENHGNMCSKKNDKKNTMDTAYGIDGTKKVDGNRSERLEHHKESLMPGEKIVAQFSHDSDQLFFDGSSNFKDSDNLAGLNEDDFIRHCVVGEPTNNQPGDSPLEEGELPQDLDAGNERVNDEVLIDSENYGKICSQENGEKYSIDTTYGVDGTKEVDGYRSERVEHHKESLMPGENIVPQCSHDSDQLGDSPLEEGELPKDLDARNERVNDEDLFDSENHEKICSKENDEDNVIRHCVVGEPTINQQGDSPLEEGELPQDLDAGNERVNDEDLIDSENYEKTCSKENDEKYSIDTTYGIDGTKEVDGYRSERVEHHKESLMPGENIVPQCSHDSDQLGDSPLEEGELPKDLDAGNERVNDEDLFDSENHEKICSKENDEDNVIRHCVVGEPTINQQGDSPLEEGELPKDLDAGNERVNDEDLFDSENHEKIHSQENDEINSIDTTYGVDGTKEVDRNRSERVELHKESLMPGENIVSQRSHDSDQLFFYGSSNFKDSDNLRGLNEDDVIPHCVVGEPTNNQQGDSPLEEGEVPKDLDDEGDETVEEVSKIRKMLEDGHIQSSTTVLEMLMKLKQMDLSLKILQATFVGKTVSRLQMHEVKEIRKVARSLVREWRAKVDAWLASYRDPEEITTSGDEIPFCSFREGELPPLSPAAELSEIFKDVDRSEKGFYGGCHLPEEPGCSDDDEAQCLIERNPVHSGIKERRRENDLQSQAIPSSEKIYNDSGLIEKGREQDLTHANPRSKKLSNHNEIAERKEQDLRSQTNPRSVKINKRNGNNKERKEQDFHSEANPSSDKICKHSGLSENSRKQDLQSRANLSTTKISKLPHEESELKNLSETRRVKEKSTVTEQRATVPSKVRNTAQLEQCASDLGKDSSVASNSRPAPIVSRQNLKKSDRDTQQLVEESRRKLREGYEKAQEDKKRRAIEMVDVQCLPPNLPPNPRKRHKNNLARSNEGARR